jgi:hypothetical protein
VTHFPVQFAQPQQFAFQPWVPQQQQPNSPLTPRFNPQPVQQPVLAAQATGLQQKPLPQASPSLQAAQGNGQKPQPVIRMQSPDAPAAPNRLVMPNPEDLGISAAKQASVQPPVEMDLTTAFARLRQLGAVDVQLNRLEIGYRARFVLPSQQAIEGTGPTEAAALAAALTRVEQK